jgi:hypothetical protein
MEAVARATSNIKKTINSSLLFTFLCRNKIANIVPRTKKKGEMCAGDIFTSLGRP